jgi:hypothetical protein
MSTILNQSEYDNGQVLTDVKLQTINEQLFGDSLPNDAAEPHVNTDGQQDIGTQTNRWRHGNFSNEVRTGNSPAIGSGGFLAGADGANGGLTCLDLSASGGSVRYFRQNNLGYFSRGEFISSSTSFRGQAMSDSGQIAHSVIDAAPSFIEAYNLKGRIRAYNTPKAGAVVDQTTNTINASFGFSSLSFVGAGGGRIAVKATFDANAAPPNTNYYVVGCSDRIIDSQGGNTLYIQMYINSKSTTDVELVVEANSGATAASFLIYWEGV